MASTSNPTTAAYQLEMMSQLQQEFINDYRLSLPFTSDPYFIQGFSKDFRKFIEHVEQNSIFSPAGLPMAVITKIDLPWIGQILGDEKPDCKLLTIVPEMQLVTFKGGRKYLMVNGENEIRASSALVSKHSTSAPVDQTPYANHLGAQSTITPAPVYPAECYEFALLDANPLTAEEIANYVDNGPLPQLGPWDPQNNFDDSSSAPMSAPNDTPLGSTDSSPTSSTSPSSDCNSSPNYTGAVPGTPKPAYSTPSTSLNNSPALNVTASGDCNSSFNDNGTVRTPKPTCTTPLSSFDDSSDDHDAVPSTPTPAPKPAPTTPGKESAKKPIPQYKEIAKEAYYNYRGADRVKGMIKFAQIYDYALRNYEDIKLRGEGFKSGFRHAVPKDFIKVEDNKKPDSSLWWTLDHDFKGDIAASNRRKPKVVESDAPVTPQTQTASGSEPPQTPRKRRATESEAEAPETPCKKSKTDNNAPVASMMTPVAQSSGQQPVHTQYYQYPQNGQQDYQGAYYQPATLNYQSGQYQPVQHNHQSAFNQPAQQQVIQSHPTHDAQQQVQQPVQPDSVQESSLQESTQPPVEQLLLERLTQQLVEQPSLRQTQQAVQEPAVDIALQFQQFQQRHAEQMQEFQLQIQRHVQQQMGSQHQYQ